MFISLFSVSTTAWSLEPIKGVILGDSADIGQFDPLAGILSIDYNRGEDTEEQMKDLMEYRGLFNQGASLKLQCDKDQRLKYRGLGAKMNATRSVIGTLQYIGLDISLKAIVAYAKEMEFSNEQFSNLSSNLVTNTCSKNLTVYSHKLLKANFDYYWKKSTFKIPTISKSPYYSEEIKAKHNTKETLAREFNYTIRNFRSLCSWNGDTDNFAMISPYLNNPFLMSIVYNHIQKQSITVNPKTYDLVHVENKNGIQVACENLICRSKTEAEFKNLFPRMIGSVELKNDLDALYCDQFIKAIPKRRDSNDTVKKWLKEQTSDEPMIEVMNLIALFTGVPEILIASTRFKDVLLSYQTSIRQRWNRWSTNKIKNFGFDLLTEESLKVQVAPRVIGSNILKGQFGVDFDVTLGEYDKVLSSFDKISARFELKFLNTYLSYVKRKLTFLNGRSDIESIIKLERKLIQNIDVQLKKKSSYYSVPIWNDKITVIIANELIRQLKGYTGHELHSLKVKPIMVPIDFRYGLFALQYIRKKYEVKQSEKQLLTFR